MQSHFNCQSVIISLQETPLGLSVHQDTRDAPRSVCRAGQRRRWLEYCVLAQ